MANTPLSWTVAACLPRFHVRPIPLNSAQRPFASMCTGKPGAAHPSRRNGYGIAIVRRQIGEERILNGGAVKLCLYVSEGTVRVSGAR